MGFQVLLGLLVTPKLPHYRDASSSAVQFTALAHPYWLEISAMALYSTWPN